MIHFHLRYNPSTNVRFDLLPIVRLWILRLLVPLGGQREFIQDNGFRDDTIAEVLGLAR